MDYIMAKIAVIGPNGRKLPETVKQMRQFCRETKSLIYEVEKFFKNCYIRDVRTYAQLAVYTFKSQMKKYCGRGGAKKVQRWLRLAPCANKQILSKDNKCSKRFVEKTRRLIDLTNDQDKIRQTCCNYVEAYRCARKVVEGVTCIRNNIEEIFEMFNSHTSSNLDTLCGEYVESTRACELLPKPKLPRKPSPAANKKYITPVFLMIDLLESMNNYTAPLLTAYR